MCRGAVVLRAQPFETMCDKCREQQTVKQMQYEAVFALGMWRAALIGGCMHSFTNVANALLVSHSLSLSEAGTLVALANFCSLLLLPLLIPMAARLTRVLGAVTMAVVLSTLILVISQEVGGADADWVARSSSGVLPPQEGDERGSLFLWWLPNVGVFGLILCSGVAPVLPLALVPTILPPISAGAAVGSAYGQLDTPTSVGQVLGSLTIGAGRKAGGFGLALRLLFAGVLASLPFTYYAERTVTACASAMHRVLGSSHEMLIEAAKDATPLPPMSSTSSRLRPMARLAFSSSPSL